MKGQARFVVLVQCTMYMYRNVCDVLYSIVNPGKVVITFMIHKFSFSSTHCKYTIINVECLKQNKRVMLTLC